MERIKQLEDMLSEGKITRRQFLARTSALGLAIAASPALLPSSVHALTPKKGGRFRIGLNTGATTDTLDTAIFSNLWSWNLNWQVRNNLVEVDHTGNVIPELAQSWEPSPDAKQWAFKLRKGVEFHNGKTLEAEDVIYSINHHRGDATKSAGKALIESVTDIKSDGKEMVIFTLKGGNADFPFIMSDVTFAIVPAGTSGAEWEKGIGTGGYILERFTPGVRSLVKRNPNYFKEGRAHFDEVETLNIEDVSARTNALKTGQIDYMNQCEMKTIHLLEKTPGVNIIKKSSGGHYTMVMSTDVPPFDNNDVRLALKYAVDREHIVKTIQRGYGTLGNDHPIAPISRFHASDLPQRAYDPDKAKFHLKKAGMQNLAVTLHTSKMRDFVDFSVLYKESATKAGIDIQLINEPADGYWSNVWLKVPFRHCYWNPRPTEDMMFTMAYANDAKWNDSHFKHERFNVLLKDARAELDSAKRGEMYGEMQRIVSDEGGTIVFMFRDFVEATGDKIRFDKLAGNLPADGLRSTERWWFA